MKKKSVMLKICEHVISWLEECYLCTEHIITDQTTPETLSHGIFQIGAIYIHFKNKH